MRWDQLAYIAYGDTYYTPDLLDANQNIPVYDWLPVGIVVACPIILSAATNSLASQLPAWKQNTLLNT